MMKKGQVSLFIVLGIIMVASLGGYIYFKTTLERIAIEPEIVAAQEVPLLFDPISVYIETCVSEVAESGLRLIGGQGGYVSFEKAGISPGITPTEGSAVMFTEGSELSVPYWFYLRDDNACTGKCAFTGKKPELYKGRRVSIESQLEEYIETNLKTCLNDFNALKAKGYTIEEFANPNAKATVTEDSIVILVDYPITAKALDSTYDVNLFMATLPVNMKSIYELSDLITNLEGDFRFIEKHTLNLIVGFSGKDQEKLPPMSDVGLGFGSSLFWRRTEVRNRLSDVLSAYIPLLQMEGTRNYHTISVPGNELQESMYNQQALVPNSEYYDLNVNFDYLGWEPYVDLNCRGEICQPESFSSDAVGIFGAQRYYFVYDLSFPVMVEVTDPDAFGGQGYNFRFMLEANIRNNEAMESVFEPVSAMAPDVSMMCDPGKRNSGQINLRLADAMQGFGVDNAEVSFSCADETCFIGRTEEGILNENFPVCAGGIISLFKDGYLGHSEFLNTRLDESGDVDVAMLPVLDKKFEIKKKRIVKNPEGWTFVDTPVGLTPKEYAYVSLVRAGEIGEAEYSTAAEYSGGLADITLVPGEYEIDIQLFTDDVVAIPDQEICQQVLLTEECITIDGFTFNESFPNGGLSLNYTFTLDDLRSDVITLYVVSPFILGIPEAQRTIDDLEQIDRVNEYSSTYALRLRPGFRQNE